MSPAAPSDLPPYDEAATFDELVFALGQRDQPTVALVECASLAKRSELEAQMAERMPEYQFRVLDVTPYQVTSLLQTLNEHLPEEVKTSPAVTYLVNVHGLENSRYLSQDGQLVPSPLTAQLNLERELLFRSVPYLIVLWGDADFFRTLQREAPDFWHWVTYRFRFEDHTARPVAELPPLPPERLPGRGNVPERQARIADLKERYDHLALDDSDKKRLLKDKIDILSLLGAEYTQAFLYKEAEQSYKSAIALQERLREDDESKGGLWFELGYVYLCQEQLPEALDAYERCKSLTSRMNTGAIFHQLGRVYQEQQQWDLALENYQQSAKWEQQAGDELEVGKAYHSIGMLYEEQQQWALALDNYRKALEWKLRSGNDSTIGSTYHQIGITYQEQNQLALALENYQQALDWKQRTGNEFGIGGTSFQFGQVYSQQHRFAEAIQWYEKAVACFIKYGDPFLAHAEAVLADVRQLEQASRTAAAAITRKKIEISAHPNAKKGQLKQGNYIAKSKTKPGRKK
ncbi:MAG TPA: tetratricopeptide repeat protein [Hymenobacter sp.]|jgi:tetratricopeptide (TPR) repeat protein|uniref:tetratricopeptide repeat protein n=1 Tax=Hymenobacter sp. TaxID=1898978 RepID=UPI002ED91439